ncbi:MAG TPA: tetraacyldisaccharide 4'-kinase, partial [Burkholderiales bacterium]|nr:tetraacyldisaccharide 4'-kinase [Burkholderiales bacterium]
LAVPPHADPAACGDEAIVLARRSGCPVWVGRDRVAAVQALLTAHADCNMILSDDGLQHYALARDFEIAVIDAERGLGNGWLLPAGPLREPAGRLDTVDAVVANGDMSSAAITKRPLYGMRLEGRILENLLNRGHCITASELQPLRIHAVAGIGHPQRFFDHLRRLGLHFTAHAFPDHHAYTPRDLAFARAGDAVVMTEKDAVKCERFATERYWMLPVDAVVDPALGQQVLRKLGHRDEQ